MGRNDFLEKIKADIEAYEEAYKNTLKSPENAKEIERKYSLEIPKHRFNFNTFFKEIINNSSIEYTLFDFFINIEKFSKSTDKFKDLSHDLIKIKDLVNS